MENKDLIEKVRHCIQEFRETIEAYKNEIQPIDKIFNASLNKLTKEFNKERDAATNKYSEEKRKLEFKIDLQKNELRESFSRISSKINRKIEGVDEDIFFIPLLLLCGLINIAVVILPTRIFGIYTGILIALPILYFTAVFFNFLNKRIKQYFIRMYKKNLGITSSDFHKRLAKVEEENFPELKSYKEIMSRKIDKLEKEKQLKIDDLTEAYKKETHRTKKNHICQLDKIFHKNSDLIKNIEQYIEQYYLLDKITKSSIEGLPSIIPFGEITQHLTEEDSLTLPALLPFLSEKPIIFVTDSPYGKKQAVDCIQTLLLRTLVNIPPAKLHLLFIDPIGLGQNASPFMHLHDYDEKLIHKQAWIKQDHIKQRLEELTDHISNVNQKHLRNEYENIEAYNAQAGETAEPYRFLVIFDFPAKFTGESCQLLQGIIENGARCGIYVLILHDAGQKFPHGFEFRQFIKTAEIISLRSDPPIWQDDDFKHCELKLDKPPEAAKFRQLVEAVGKAAQQAEKVEVPFEKILAATHLKPDDYWKADTSDTVQIPLGKHGDKIQQFELGKGTAHHALTIGKTGSGKSTLLHILITALALKYNPDELQLYLIDFKGGVEFKAYANSKLPHAKVIAIQSEREFGLSVLKGLRNELKRRFNLYREYEAKELKDYRQKSQKKLPRILLLVDEFQIFFNEDDILANEAKQILEDLARQGRSFGIHILLSSQTLQNSNLPPAILEQISVRIVLQCSETDSRLALCNENSEARLISRPGEAIYNASNGQIEGNNWIQIAWLDEESAKDYLQQINSLAKHPPSEQIIFEGNEPVAMEQHSGFNQQLKTTANSKPHQARAWLGDPVAIKEPTTAHFHRQTANNLLIVGQNERHALGILLSSILSLATQQPEALFYVLDFSAVDSENSHVFKTLAEKIALLKLGKRRQLEGFINSINDELAQRLQEEEKGVEHKAPIYLIIYGLQKARDLEQPDYLSPPLNEDMMTKIDSGAQFKKILEEGSDLGIHTLVWVDSLNNLVRRLARDSHRHFDMRVVFQMNDQDSQNLIDSGQARNLDLYCALFYDEESGETEKFRPFGLPSEEWLDGLGMA